MNSSKLAVAGSFRDPAGFVFVDSLGRICRQINRVERDNYECFISSGLYDQLTSKKMLVAHVEDATVEPRTSDAYKVIRPDRLPFISYPYEWCFSQLRDAALLTLRVQQLALSFGMSLKDASAYNVQFDPRPVFIDTLSFERYQEGSPWVAYRQFCQHFLAPLALMRYRDVRLGQLLRVFIDGVPLDLAASLLPASTRLKPSLLAHIHLHAKAQQRFAASGAQSSPRRQVSISRSGLVGLLTSLEAFIEKLDCPRRPSEWGDYYGATNYSADAAADKERLVAGYLNTAGPTVVWDLGANTGRFSRLSAERGALTIAFDGDHAAVDQHYQAIRAQDNGRILPLALDLTNPSPSIGWANTERPSLFERGHPDAILALALIHHLAIGNNVPLADVAALFARLSQWLIIEFVPKTDSQVQRMLATRADIFSDYTQEGFERAFGTFFEFVRCEPVAESTRLMYLMRARATDR